MQLVRQLVVFSIRPQRAQRKRQRLERRGADVVAVLEGGGEGPGAGGEGEGLEGAGVGVDEPEVGDGVRRGRGRAFRSGRSGGCRGRGSRRPSRGRGRWRGCRGRPACARGASRRGRGRGRRGRGGARARWRGASRRGRRGRPERAVELAGHAEGGAGVAGGRAGVEVQAAAGDLGDHVRGRVEDVLVGRGAGGAGLGVHGARIARRGGGVIGGAWGAPSSERGAVCQSRTFRPPWGTGGPGGAKGRPVAWARAGSVARRPTRQPGKRAAEGLAEGGVERAEGRRCRRGGRRRAG